MSLPDPHSHSPGPSQRFHTRPCHLAGERLRTSRPEDAAELVRLFLDVFTEDPTRYQPVNTARWTWKFFSHPGRNHSCVAVQREGIIAHVGGISLPTRCGGILRHSVNATDHMVSPAARRNGAFVRTMTHWLETYNRNDVDFLGFGFPTQETFEIGRRFLGYWSILEVEALVSPGNASHTPTAELRYAQEKSLPAGSKNSGTGSVRTLPSNATCPISSGATD